VKVMSREISLAVLLSEGDKHRLTGAVREVLTNDPRIQAMERVAEAARVDARDRLGLMGGEGMTFTEALAIFPASDNVQAVLEALGALEALDEPARQARAHPVVNIGDTDENADWIKPRK